MNVTVLSFYYLPDYSGGAKQWAAVMKRIKDNHRVNFHVIAAWLNHNHPKKEIMGGIAVTRVPIDRNTPLLSFWRSASFEILKRRANIDLVQANGLKLDHAFPLWIAHRLGKPTVGRLSIANSDINFKMHGQIFGRFHKYCLKRVDKYVAISSALEKEVAREGLSGKKCVTIYNGVDTEIFRPCSKIKKRDLRNKLGLDDEIILLFVGVMDERKGVDLLIQAFQRVAQDKKKVRLLMVGPANREDYGLKYVSMLRGMANEMGISQIVEFREATENVIQYYHAADIFVLPSRREGMPNVALEAMACGLPIIGTKISGTEDLVLPGKTGFIVPLGAKKELAEAIANLVNNPKQRYEFGRNAFEHIVAKHELSEISSSYAKLYRHLYGKS